MTLLFPTALTNVFGFLQPYIILPHLVVFNLNPWFNSRLHTEICVVLVVCLLGPFLFCQLFSLWFNYQVLSNNTSRVSDQVYSRLFLLISVPIDIVVNAYLIFFAIHKEDSHFREEIQLADDRLLKIFDAYGALPITPANKDWEALVILIEVVFAVFISLTYVPVIEILLLRRVLVLNRLEVSRGKNFKEFSHPYFGTYVMQVRILIMLQLYMLLYVILMGTPTTIVCFIIFLDIRYFTNFPSPIFFIIPFILPCICFCLIYLCLIRVYRRAAIRIIRRLLRKNQEALPHIADMLRQARQIPRRSNSI